MAHPERHDTPGGRRPPARAELLATLRMVAPGTPLREGMDGILRGRTGALIVVGDSPQVMRLLDGGFKLDAPFSAAALYELAKMDGGIVLTRDASRILYANVQLNPDPSVPSQETGIRHRTAERVARQTGELVIAVSSRRSVITIYRGELKYSLRDIGFILDKANQAVQVLQRYRTALDEALLALTALELEDLVTVQDFATVLQRAELVQNVAEEIEAYVAELGTEGRLVSVQMSEVVPEVEETALLVIRDYVAGQRDGREVQARLRARSAEGLLDLEDVARLMGYPGGEAGLGLPATPRGYRVLHGVPRLPAAVVERVVARFGNLQRVLEASLEELDAVEGVGEARARALKENLRRVREQAVLGRTVS
ncbi:MAG: DNA integrity scanning diadenylate cyclase DisA [Firmicutes bacterium]|nr:DNA integrity scanning diadenylate cyclase DisA [Bacillota bacterium]